MEALLSEALPFSSGTHRGREGNARLPQFVLVVLSRKHTRAMSATCYGQSGFFCSSITHMCSMRRGSALG
eukprot:scaffold98752_cov17-Tisochrysis_lutea.AAC.3